MDAIRSTGSLIREEGDYGEYESVSFVGDATVVPTASTPLQVATDPIGMLTLTIDASLLALLPAHDVVPAVLRSLREHC